MLDFNSFVILGVIDGKYIDILCKECGTRTNRFIKIPGRLPRAKRYECRICSVKFPTTMIDFMKLYSQGLAGELTESRRHIV